MRKVPHSSEAWTRINRFFGIDKVLCTQIVEVNVVPRSKVRVVEGARSNLALTLFVRPHSGVYHPEVELGHLVGLRRIGDGRTLRREISHQISWAVYDKVVFRRSKSRKEKSERKFPHSRGLGSPIGLLGSYLMDRGR